MPQTTAYTNAAPAANTSPARSLLGAVGALLLAVLLLAVATIIRKGHHNVPVTPSRHQVGPVGAKPRPISLGRVQPGTTYPLPLAPERHGLRHYTLLPPHPGLSLTFHRGHPSLVISQDRRPGPLSVKISFGDGRGGQTVIPIVGTVTPAGAAVPEVTAPGMGPVSPSGAPAGPSSTAGPAPTPRPAPTTEPGPLTGPSAPDGKPVGTT